MAIEITIDATATFGRFVVSGHGEFPTRPVQVLRLEPGVYTLGTLFGPTFVFAVTAAGLLDVEAGLIFLSGAGTTPLAN